MLENWVLSLSDYKQVALKVADCVLARTHVESIEDEEGIEGAKAVWTGNPGESTMKVNARSWKGDAKIEGDVAPIIEYWQQGDKRGFAVRNPKDISFELDRKTLSQLAMAKGAWIATIAGAGVGLLGWFLLALANRASLIKEEQEDSSPPMLATESHDAND